MEPTGISAIGIDWKLLIAQIINFLILLYLLKRFLYRPILNILDKRQKEVDEGLKAATHSKDIEQKMLERQKEIMKDTRAEAQNIIAVARDEAEKIKAETLKKVEKETENLKTRANLQIEKDRTTMQQELKKEIVHLSVLVASKVISQRLDEEGNKKLVEKTLNELKKT